MKNFDTFDLDFRSPMRRASGGQKGIALLISCRGDLGSSKSTQSSTGINTQATAQGGGSGSSTFVTGSSSSVGNVDIQTVDPAIVDSAFKFGAETETNASQTIGQSNATIQNIAGTLATLTANATPQTAAAQSEIAAGGSPLGGVSIPNNIVVIATAGIVGVAAIFFFVTRHKS